MAQQPTPEVEKGDEITFERRGREYTGEVGGVSHRRIRVVGEVDSTVIDAEQVVDVHGKSGDVTEATVESEIESLAELVEAGGVEEPPENAASAAFYAVAGHSTLYEEAPETVIEYVGAENIDSEWHEYTAGTFKPSAEYALEAMAQRGLELAVYHRLVDDE